MSRLTASSTAHSAARMAVLEPSTPTTAGAQVPLALGSWFASVGAVDRLVLQRYLPLGSVFKE